MKYILTALLMTSLTACAGAATPPAGGLQVTEAWARATPPNAPVAGGYLTINNQTSADDRLLRVESAASQRLEIHEMSHDDGVMRMRELVDGLALPAGQVTSLKPGGLHLMFIEPKQPFVAGQTVQATLVFQQAGTQTVSFEIRALDAAEHGAKQH